MNTKDRDRFFLYCILFIPLFIITGLYFFTWQTPVGFNDAHIHINQYNLIITKNEFLDFDFAQRTSFNYVGLYIITSNLENILNLDPVLISSFLPVIINSLLIVISFIIIRKISNEKIAIVTTLIFGLENQILIFGQEYRTQTLGVLFLLALLFILIKIGIKESKDYRGLYIISIFFLFGSAFSSFVSTVYMVIIIAFFIIFYFLISKILKDKIPSINRTFFSIFLLMIIIFYSYLAYFSGGFDEAMGAILEMIRESSKSAFIIAFEGGNIYGILINIITNLIRLLFIITLPLVVFYGYKSKKPVLLAFIFTFSILFFFVLLDTAFGFLSVGRIYAVAFLLVAFMMSIFLITTSEQIQNIHKIRYFKFVLPLFLFVIIVSSIFHIPQYLIGNTEPIRSFEEIDTVSYWNQDEWQYSAGTFIFDHYYYKNIAFHSIITNYYLRIGARQNELNLTTTSDPFNDINNMNNCYFILHDKFDSQDYYARETFPTVFSYLGPDVNQIFSNHDYIIFTKGNANEF